LLAESGSGKSTFINTMLNHIQSGKHTHTHTHTPGPAGRNQGPELWTLFPTGNLSGL